MILVKDLVKEIWESGVSDFDEIDRNWDPSDRQEGIDETFEEYWDNNKEDIIEKLQTLETIKNQQII